MSLHEEDRMSADLHERLADQADEAPTSVDGTALGVSLGTVKSQHHDAIRRLRTLLPAPILVADQ